MDVFWHDTMIVIPWHLVVIAGSLVFGVLIAGVILVARLLGRARPRS